MKTVFSGLFFDVIIRIVNLVADVACLRPFGTSARQAELATVAELVDAHDSKSCEIYLMSVQLRPVAPKNI